MWAKQRSVKEEIQEKEVDDGENTLMMGMESRSNMRTRHRTKLKVRAWTEGQRKQRIRPRVVQEE